MMHMTFYWGKQVTILFDSWKTDSWTSYALSLIACFLIAAFYQYLEGRRFQFTRFPSKTAPPVQSGATAPLLFRKFGGNSAWSPSRFAAAILFAVSSAISYMLMLVIMSFNAGVFVAVVLGLGFGYLVFRGGDEGGVVLVDNPCACA